MIEVRRAVPDDVATILDVGRATWRATYVPLVGEAYVEDFLARWWTAEGLARGIEAGRVWVGCVAGAVTGMAAYGLRDRVLELHRLYVHPAHQGRGVGSALLDAVMAAERGNADRIELAVMDGNDAAHAFYEAQGFRETGREPDDLGGPAEIWMSRTASPSEAD